MSKNRNKVIPPVRVSEVEKTRYIKTAKRRGQSFSEWFRSIAEKDSKED